MTVAAATVLSSLTTPDVVVCSEAEVEVEIDAAVDAAVDEAVVDVDADADADEVARLVVAIATDPCCSGGAATRISSMEKKVRGRLDCSGPPGRGRGGGRRRG